MAVRFLELRQVLTPTGSRYLHCDPTAYACLRLLLDAVLETAACRNELVSCYSGPANTSGYFARKHDTILFYAQPGTFVRPVGPAARSVREGQF